MRLGIRLSLSNKTLNLRIEYGEKHLGILVKAAGGRWNKQKKRWEISYKEVQDSFKKMSYIRNNLWNDGWKIILC